MSTDRNADDLGHDELFGGMHRSCDRTLADNGCHSLSSLDNPLEGCPGDDLVSVVEGDEAGQSDMYLCRLDNGFAQETTL